MHPLKTLASAAILALSLLGTVAPAQADIEGADKFRVVGLSGTQTLPLMNGPARWAGVQVQIPFDARNLRTTGVRQGIWLQVSYRATNGYDFTGWVQTINLAADYAGEPTVFRVVNVARKGSVPLTSYDGYGTVARIPAGATQLYAAGPCQEGYCPVNYQTKRGTLEGLVNQANLAIARPSNPGFALIERPHPNAQAPDTTYGYDANDTPDYVAEAMDAPPAPMPRIGWDRSKNGHHGNFWFRY